MKTLNKEFEYRGYKFNIKLETHNRVEKKSDGNIFHTITINSMGYDNYYKKQEVSDDLVEIIVQAYEVGAKKYVDTQIDSTTGIDKRFSELGFK